MTATPEPVTTALQPCPALGTWTPRDWMAWLPLAVCPVAGMWFCRYAEKPEAPQGDKEDSRCSLFPVSLMEGRTREDGSAITPVLSPDFLWI